jgi:hypothetical protein
MVGAQDVALGCHVNDLSKSAGHSGALRRNGYLRPVPHPVWLKAGKPEIRKQTQKSPSSFGESDGDGPMTEPWCAVPRWKSPQMTFGKQATAASHTEAGHEQANAVGQGARPYRQVESILKPGTELRSGERVPVLPQDDLEKRAEVKMRRWLRTPRRRDRGKFT